MRTYGHPTKRRSETLTASAGWVRVEIGPEGPVCHLVATTHRRLVVRPISLGTATALMARGVPSVIRHRSVSRPVSVTT